MPETKSMIMNKLIFLVVKKKSETSE